jgi:hypothetical protein
MLPIERAITDIYEIAECDSYDEGVYNMLRYREHLGSAQVVVDDARATIVSGPGQIPFALTVGRYVGITDDGTAHVAGLVEVALTRVIGGNRFMWEHRFDPVPAESVRAETNIDELGDMVEQSLPQALDEFIRALRGDDGELLPPDAPRPEHPRGSDNAERQENREQHAREIAAKVEQFVDAYSSIDQPATVDALVAGVDDPKFDARSAHAVLTRLVDEGRARRRRTLNGDEYDVLG